MSYQEEIQYSLTVNTEMAYSEIRKLETTLVRVLGYIEQLVGDNPSLKKLINLLQATINTVRTLQAAIRAMNLASASTPLGFAFAATSFVAAGLSAGALYSSTVGV